MSTAEVYRTALQIVNEVQRKLGVNSTGAFETTKHSRMLLDFLNDVISECSDFGDWPQMLRTTKVTARSSAYIYEVSASGNIKDIYEVAWGDQSSSMFLITTEEIRQRNRKLKSGGTPREFAIMGVSGADPIMHVYPIPITADISAQTSAGGIFDVLYYKKPRIMTTADTTAAAIPLFPARMLIQGVYAKILLHDNGGVPTPNYQAAYAEYQTMRKESLNRLTYDTGSDVYFTPEGRW